MIATARRNEINFAMFLRTPRFIAISIFMLIPSNLYTLKVSSNSDDSYSFVALIDIVLTDGAKRTCTGTIIHDNVVITAAHCFIQERKKHIQAELTACFIVIGTKKMFETGYEQYFPIERVVTHPSYKGWTADLALVFTFASMVSDKPGRIVPLASDNIKVAFDANVTVLSWGRSKEDIKPAFPMELFSDTSDTSSSHEELQLPVTTKHKRLRKRFKIKSKGNIKYKSDDRSRKSQTSVYHEYPRADDSVAYYPRDNNIKKLVMNNDQFDEFESEILHQKSTTYGIPVIKYDEQTTINDTKFNSKEDRRILQKKKKTLNNIKSKSYIRKHRNSFLQMTRNVMSHYNNNWRRKMGTQQNKLTIQVFSSVNVASCKKIIEKSKSSLYQIHNGNEIICYSNEDRYVTAEDSGAPAMRHGHLVAVTVGGAEFDEDNVAVAMKISCFCSWIAENLPDGGPHMQCCTNCCDDPIQSQEFSGENTYRHMRKKRKKI